MVLPEQKLIGAPEELLRCCQVKQEWREGHQLIPLSPIRNFLIFLLFLFSHKNMGQVFIYCMRG